MENAIVLVVGVETVLLAQWDTTLGLGRRGAGGHGPNASWLGGFRLAKLSLPNDDTAQCALQWGRSWCYIAAHVLQKVLNP